MGRKGKTKNWARKQDRDLYVRKARSSGARARSAFKLEEIDKRYKLIRPGMHVVDLGAAPGSWSQYVVSRLSGNGSLAAVDLLPMQAVEGASFVQGDFTDIDIQERLIDSAEGRKFDLVLSDMAPNITGIRVTDQARAAVLQECIVNFCDNSLVPGGNLLTKVFEGENMTSVRKEFNERFESVQTIKPDASRSQSKEVYLLARNFRSGS